MGQEKKGQKKTSNRKGHLAAVKPSPNITKDRAPGNFSFLGTKTDELGLQFITQSLWVFGIDGATSPKKRKSAITNIIAALVGIGPKKELEALLAVQMLGVHNATMELMRRGMHPKQDSDGVNNNVSRVAKLMSLFLSQIECLQKLRGQGSQQKVTVEHITHVHSGGQAIVGTVTPGGEGEGEG